MEDSWEKWVSELGMNINQCQTNPFVNIEENRRDITQQPTFSSKTASEAHNRSNAGTWKPPSKEDSNSEQLVPSKPHLAENLNFEARENQGTKRVRSFSETQDHVMSERKRRQEMAEKFIALSAIIPGLKKIDKASVLGEAINYVKQLQERIRVMEKESKKQSSKSMISIKKSHPCSASRETNSNGSHQVVPEVEAIGLELGKEVLIRIHCEKRKGILLRLLALLENLHLSIASSSVLPFGQNYLNITIIAQMGEEYNMTLNKLVKNLRVDLLKLDDMQVCSMLVYQISHNSDAGE